MKDARRALVLGAGGVVGTAWTAGLVTGLRHAAVDLAEADLIVGTSAGAIVGAMLATGQDLGLLDAPPPPDGRGGPASRPDPGLSAEVFRVLGDAELEPAAARRRVGELALAARTIPEEAHIARMRGLLPAEGWPERELLLTTVDVATGEPKVWDRTGGAPLPAVVAASCAMPGVFPPITMNGRRYMDGGMVSGTNADLAAGAGVLVLVEPLAHLFPRQPLERELARAGAGTVTAIAPDAAAISAFGPDLHDRAAWQASYGAGFQQAAEVAGCLGASWR